MPCCSLEDEIRASVLEMGFLLGKISSSSSSAQLGQPQQRAAVQQQADVTLQPLMDFLDGRCVPHHWRNDGVAAASSDGGSTGGRGPPTVLLYVKSEGRGPDVRK